MPFRGYNRWAAKISEGAPHGMCTTRKDEVNADLLAFIKS